MTPEEQRQAEQRQADEQKQLLLLLALSMSNFGPQVASSIRRVAIEPLTYLGGVSDELLAKLIDAHAHAWYLGRVRAGDTAPFNATDVQMGRAIAFGQLPYLSNFLSKAASGGYLDTDGNVKIAAIEQRANLYSSRLFGSANASWVNTLPEATVFTWHTTALENCSQCASYNGLKYTRATLPGVPGDGHTDCNTKCRCYLTTETDAVSFVFED
jgi:hypothetical protein